MSYRQKKCRLEIAHSGPASACGPRQAIAYRLHHPLPPIQRRVQSHAQQQRHRLRSLLRSPAFSQAGSPGSNSRSGSGCVACVAIFFGVARFPARMAAYGEWIPLEEQDRSLWDNALIAEGFHYLDQAQRSGYAGRYYLEALIASLHCAAPHFAATDWKTIHDLYLLLENLEPASTLIRLNRLIAKSYAQGPLPVITELTTITAEGRPGAAFLLAATKGHVYQRAGYAAKARDAYEEALSLAQHPLDRQFIRKRIEATAPNT